MRCAAAATIIGLVAACMPAQAAPPHADIALAPRSDMTRVEYWCSPGFAPRGGRCIATIARDELLVHEIDAYAPAPRRYRRHRRHGLHELY